MFSKAEYFRWTNKLKVRNKNIILITPKHKPYKKSRAWLGTDDKKASCNKSRNHKIPCLSVLICQYFHCVIIWHKTVILWGARKYRSSTRRGHNRMKLGDIIVRHHPQESTHPWDSISKSCVIIEISRNNTAAQLCDTCSTRDAYSS